MPNEDIGQAGAIIKRGRANVDDTVGNIDAGQAGAVCEGPIPNIVKVAAERDMGQPGAILKCVDADIDDTGRDVHIG